MVISGTLVQAYWIFFQSAQWVNMWEGNRDCLCRSTVRDTGVGWEMLCGQKHLSGLGEYGKLALVVSRHSEEMNDLRPSLLTVSRRRKRQTNPVSLPAKSHGQRNLVGCSLWNSKELGMTEWLTHTHTHRHTHTHTLTVWLCLGKGKWLLYLSNQQFLTECLLCERQYSWC